MLPILVAFVAGALSVFGFAPFGWVTLPMVGAAALFWLWAEAPSPRAAAGIGFAFGLGFFGAGVSWVSIALHRFGAMPLPLAAIATAGFCAYLALFPALAGWAASWLDRRTGGGRVEWFAVPTWTLAEWARSWVLTGFPWLSLGHSQVPGSPLAGYAPVAGTFGVTLAVVTVAAMAARTLRSTPAPAHVGTAPAAPPSAASSLLGVAMAIGVVAAGIGLRHVDWTRSTGEPLAVSLLQGNVAQELKFQPGFRERTLELYRGLVERARGRLVVLPESALPMFAHEVPKDFAEFVARDAQRRGGDTLLGVFIYSPDNGGTYHNSVITSGLSGPQVYQKRHLVPFGETIPLKSITGWFINEILEIPLADQTPGPANPPPLSAAGQQLALGICYEDAFGAELIRQLPAATLLVNVSNDAWYGRSVAAEQHHQIAQARALETGRWMLRATQTGITALIDHTGRERARLPWFSAGVLEGQVQGRAGATPYVRLGDWLAVVTTLAILGILVAIGMRRGAQHGARHGAD